MLSDNKLLLSIIILIEMIAGLINNCCTNDDRRLCATVICSAFSIAINPETSLRELKLYVILE